jgi:transposase
MISREREAEILRLHKVERWPVGTIARHLNVHHYVVERVLRPGGGRDEVIRLRPSIIDPFVAYIRTVLTKYPDVCASRLFQMVRKLGYPGCPSHFRAHIARIRPRPLPEAYLRLRTLPSDQCQVDWGSFGTILVGRALRKLMAFVLTLSYSRYIFLRFYLGADMSAWLDAHVRAFEFFGGVPHKGLYDNLRSAVISRVGLPDRPDAIQFNSKFLELVTWYNFEPRPVAVRRGNEKGRVERSIRYVRDNFFAAREFSNIDDLNAQALKWCLNESADRKCPQDLDGRLVRECYEAERPLLIAPPSEPFPAEFREPVVAHKTPYVRFDLNDYSIPHTHVQRTLEVIASRETVRIVDGLEVIATHRRSFDRHQQIENPQHVRELEARKRAARQDRAIDRLHYAAPSAAPFFQLAALRGAHLGSLTRGLIELLDTHGSTALEAAIKAALERDSAYLAAVRHLIDIQQAQQGESPPVPVALPDDPRVRNLAIRPHNLADYEIPQETPDDTHLAADETIRSCTNDGRSSDDTGS